MFWQRGPGLGVQLNCSHQPWLGHSSLAGRGGLAGAGIQQTPRLPYCWGTGGTCDILQSQRSQLGGKWNKPQPKPPCNSLSSKGSTLIKNLFLASHGDARLT